jgi:hypothetical protein
MSTQEMNIDEMLVAERDSADRNDALRIFDRTLLDAVRVPGLLYV